MRLSNKDSNVSFVFSLQCVEHNLPYDPPFL